MSSLIFCNRGKITIKLLFLLCLKDLPYFCVKGVDVSNLVTYNSKCKQENIRVRRLMFLKFKII